MPTLIFYTCPKCHARIETQDAYQSVGPPFILCSKCGGIFSVAKNRTEWELKRPWQRRIFFAKVAFFSLWLGFGTGILLTLLAQEFLATPVSQWFAVPLGIGAWYWMLSADLRRNIQESRERMADPKHREILEYLGLLAKAN